MHVTRLACLTIVSALLGCGGGGSDDGGTTGPPPPPPGGNQTLGSIQTNVSTMNLAAGNSQTISVTAYDTQNAVISNPGSPTFTSASAAIADVDNSGTVTGISNGTTNVTASLTIGSVTRTAAVAVTVTGTLPSQASINTTQGDVFTPNRVMIVQGGSVTWTFGTTIHNVTFAATPGSPQNISDTYSTSVSRTFNAAGTFSFQCTIHAGMNGQVIAR